VRRFRFHRKARAELRKAHEHYNGEGDTIARAFATEARAAIDLILTFPASSSADRSGMRRKPLRTFPYNIIYYFEEREDLVEIIGFVHQRRSDYWRDRL
jgi:plasmid stabilization system protein ParE